MGYTLNWYHHAEGRGASVLTQGQVSIWRSPVQKTTLSSTKFPPLLLPTPIPKSRMITNRKWTTTSVPTRLLYPPLQPLLNQNPRKSERPPEYPRPLRNGPVVTMLRQRGRLLHQSQSEGVPTPHQHHRPPLLVLPHRGQGLRLRPRLWETKPQNESQRVLVQTGRRGRMARRRKRKQRPSLHPLHTRLEKRRIVDVPLASIL